MEQQDEEIKELTRLLNLVWGSEELAHERLNRLRDSYNCDLFNATLSLVQVAFVPESFFTDLFGNRTSAGSRYEPASTYMEATIYLGPRVLESKELASISKRFLAKAHEISTKREIDLAMLLYGHKHLRRRI